MTPPPDLAGVWRLTRWESHSDGEVTLPYGSEVTGLLLISAPGYMSAQIMLPETEALEATAAVIAGQQRYIAYCGPCSFDPATMTLTATVEASVSRSWVGSQQVRQVHLDGDVMELRPPPRPSGGQMVLSWRRL